MAVRTPFPPFPAPPGFTPPFPNPANKTQAEQDAKALSKWETNNAVGGTFPSVPGVSEVKSAAHDVTGLVEAVTSQRFWIRAGEVVLGLAFILIGFDQMLKLGIVNKGAKAAATGALL